MPIKGISDRGLSFPEIGQIRKGAPKGNNRPGKDLTYFRVEFGENEEKSIEAFTKAYGETPTAIRIILPFDDIEEVWQSWLEAYTAGRMVARSDGEFLRYLVDTKTGDIIVKNGVNDIGERVPHPIDDVAGYDYKNNPVKFKPSGRLKVIIPELKRAAFLTFLTTSIYDIANLSKQLRGYADVMGGTLKGIPFYLRRSPKMISVPNPQQQGQKMRVEKWMVSLETAPDWVEKTLQWKYALPEPQDDVLMIEPGVDYIDDEEDGDIIELETEPLATLEDGDIIDGYFENRKIFATVANRDGTLYKDLPVDKLKFMQRAVVKRIAENELTDEARAELELKRDAAEFYINNK